MSYCNFNSCGCWKNKTCDCRSCSPNPCCGCCRGADGKSAYQIAVENGFIGTEQQWLESLKGVPGPFRSSYIEATGSGQAVANGANIAFSTNPNDLDVVGTDISLNAGGTVFRLNRAGLYHVEWSVNLSVATQPVVLCLTEDGTPSSAMSNAATIGNHSSGALISVAASDVPVTLSLTNFGSAITLADAQGVSGSAASIRILRFADLPMA